MYFGDECKQTRILMGYENIPCKKIRKATRSAPAFMITQQKLRKMIVANENIISVADVAKRIK